MARGRNNSSRSPSSNLYSSKRPALIKDFQLRPTIRKHLHVRKGRTPPPITLNEAFSEFEDALEAIVQLDEEPHSDGHDSEGSEVAIIMLLGWAEQLRLEWAFMKGARSAAPPLPTESGRPIMEYATPEGSPPASGLVTRGLGRLTAESILRPPQTQRKPDHTVKQFQRGGANRRQTSEGEDERASVNGAHVDTHTDEAMDEDADEDGDEMEERDTIPPDDYDYEWEIEAQRARKRRRSGKVSDVATEKNQTESGFVDLGEYEVETILDSMMLEDGDVRYFIHWKSYPESQRTWEPVEHLQGALELIERFHQEFPGKPRAQITKGLAEEFSKQSGPAVNRVTIPSLYVSALGDFFPKTEKAYRAGLSTAQMTGEGVSLRKDVSRPAPWDLGKWKAFAIAKMGEEMKDGDICALCSTGRGRFSECYIWDQAGDKCANCVWSRHACRKSIS